MRRLWFDIAIFLSGALLVLAGILFGQFTTLFPKVLGSFAKRFDIIRNVVFVYGALLTALGIYGFAQWKTDGATITEFLNKLALNSPKKISQQIRIFVEFNHNIPVHAWLWFLPLLMIGTTLFAYFLSQPMRGDEAFTFLNYVNKNIWNVFEYSAPNNHVLFTILVKISTLFWGSEPVIIRLPAFMAGILNLFLVFYWVQINKPTLGTGVISFSGMAATPYFALYATNARGYTLIITLTLLLAIFWQRYIMSPSQPRLFFLAFLSALILLTMPSGAIGVAGLFMWAMSGLLLRPYPFRQILKNVVLPYALWSAFLTAIFYTPVIIVSSGVAAITENKFVQGASLQVFLPGFLPNLQKAFVEITRDIPTTILVFCGFLFLAGLYSSWKNKDWAFALIFPALMIGAFGVLLIGTVLPYARTWIYLIPFALILMDYGLTSIVKNRPGFIRSVSHTAIVLSGAFLALSLMANNTIAKYPDTSAFPEAKMVVEYLKPIFKEGDSIHVTNTANVPIEYYLWYYGMPERDFSTMLETGTRFYVVKKSHYSIEDMTDKPVRLLLDFENMALYERIKE
jgi:hypothetical protein